MNRKHIAMLILTFIISSIFGWFVIGPVAVSILHLKPEANDGDSIENNQNESDNTTEPPSLNQTVQDNTTYYDTIEFSQENEKLDGEVVQYQIKFRENDTLSLDMDISYGMTQNGAVFYLLYLTNGSKTVTLHASDETVGRIADVTTFRKHRMLLGKLLFRPNRGLSDDKSFSEDLQIKKNDTWYLTMAVAISQNESLIVSFRTQQESMTYKQITRSSAVTIASALNADLKGGSFLGRYKSYSFFGMGVSHCDATQQFPVSNGGIICVDVFNVMDGALFVGNSFGNIWNQNDNTGNQSILLTSNNPNITKYWHVDVQSFSIGRKASILVFVVDVNPYSIYHENNYKSSSRQTIWENISSMAKVIMEKYLSKISHGNFGEMVE